jgi:hypothetical protein
VAVLPQELLKTFQPLRVAEFRVFADEPLGQFPVREARVPGLELEDVGDQTLIDVRALEQFQLLGHPPQGVRPDLARHQGALAEARAVPLRRGGRGLGEDGRRGQEQARGGRQ